MLDEHTLVDDGVVDLIVEDFHAQEGGNKQNCVARVVLDKIVYMGSDIGYQWKFMVALGGKYHRWPRASRDYMRLDHQKTFEVGRPVKEGKVANKGETVSFDMKLMATEVDNWDNDVGQAKHTFSFVCDGNEHHFHVGVPVHDKKTRATIFFFFKVYTRIV